MRILNIFWIVVISAGLMLSGCASSSSNKAAGGKNPAVASKSQTTKISKKRSKRSKQSNVYVLRGLANVFSLGMDTITKKINAKGIKASVSNHAGWSSIANKIIADKKAGNRGKVILIGHSLGANALVDIALKLKQHKIKVDLLIAFDPTVRAAVPSNVRKSVNYYRKGTGWGTKLHRAKGSRGSFKNVELSKRSEIDHFNIDESKYLHRKVMRMVVRTVGRYK